MQNWGDLCLYQIKTITESPHFFKLLSIQPSISIGTSTSIPLALNTSTRFVSTTSAHTSIYVSLQGVYDPALACRHPESSQAQQRHLPVVQWARIVLLSPASPLFQLSVKS